MGQEFKLLSLDFVGHSTASLFKRFSILAKKSYTVQEDETLIHSNLDSISKEYPIRLRNDVLERIKYIKAGKTLTREDVEVLSRNVSRFGRKGLEAMVPWPRTGPKAGTIGFI